MTDDTDTAAEHVAALHETSGSLKGELARRIRVEEDRTNTLAAQARNGAESEELFRLLVASVIDYAIFLLDAEGNVATWNAGAERIKGYTASEIIGRHFSCFYPAEDVQAGKCERELEAATRDGRFEDEGWRVRKDGSRFWANVVISAVRDQRGKLVGFSKITRDLTERKRSDEERTARLAAERANKAKDEFLAVLGHELRSPLAPIVTALQLIELRDDMRCSNEYQVIDRQVKHMMRLVDDLLDVSRITQGKVELKKQPIDLRGSIAKAIELASPLFEQRHQHFEVEVPQRPIVVNGDEARLSQVFANLLTNAAKYTPTNGHISLTIRQAGDHVMIDVRDDGAGIDQELLPRLFELFVQGNQGPDRAVGGLGLGLALVRSLVQLHGGRVEARSAGLGLGSTFTVGLPTVDRPAGVEAQEALADALPTVQVKQRILIVDDNEDARALLSEILGTIGHEVRTAADGFEALEVVKAFTPEVAILDIGLPGMDGYGLATRLREAMKTVTPRLISLTGYGQQVDRDRSQAAGFDRHLVKPVDLRTLLRALGELRG